MSVAIAEQAGEIGRGTAAALKSGAENLLRFGLAILPLYPAVKINLEAAAGQGETWAAVGIGFVLFGALAIHHSLRGLHDRQAITSLLWGVLGVGFLALNGMNAIANLASHTDHSRDDNRAKMQTAADISTQRHELTERRKVQFALAGEATPESIDAEIKAAKTANSALWRASESCDPNRITRDVTKAFCKSVADLEAKKAAATKRDDIDAKLAKLDEKAEAKGEAPSTVDSFADAMADGLTAFGYQIDEKAKLAIVRARDWSKAIGVEVLAAFGPAALLGLFLRGNAPMPMPRTQAAKSRASRPRASVSKLKPEKVSSEGGTVIKFPPIQRLAAFVSGVIPKRKEADPVHLSGSADDFRWRFLEVTADPKDRIKGGDMQRRYCDECDRLGVDKMEAKAFSQDLQSLVQYGKTAGGRPYYFGVKWRDVPLPAAAPKGTQGPRMVIDNTVSPSMSGAAAAWG